MGIAIRYSIFAASILSATVAQADGIAPRKSNPHEDAAQVGVHMRAARRIAEEDLAAHFRWRCLTSPLDPQIVAGVQHEGLVPPAREFDNLYSVGQNAVSSHVIDTGAGRFCRKLWPAVRLAL
ncbi:hypothetical protein [Novosphingobium sp. PP1Y]|uniref:hypothetical protein n=1 Tax=Novosphingobium sp. PP1Y TaxID=702113 RepID=UPI0002EF9E53|nr:hypothetical protein [Novosphingobium sp. PP1Y]